MASPSDRLGERLDEATGRSRRGDRRPADRARMQLALGQSQLGLGHPDKAVMLMRRPSPRSRPSSGPITPTLSTSLPTSGPMDT